MSAVSEQSEKLYEYLAEWYSDGRSERFVCQGRKSFVEQFILQTEVADTFGGYILSLNTETNEEFLGVWGKRNCQRFRQILRERGAAFELIKNVVVPELRRSVMAN